MPIINRDIIMKKIHTTHLLFSLALIVQTNTSFPMQNIALKAVKIGISSLCSGFELICALNPIWTTYLIYQPRMLAKKNKEYCSNAPKNIINFVDNIKQQRNIQENLHVVIKENGHRSYNMESIKNILYIPPTVSKELEDLLEKKELLLEDQLKLNYHTATIHHELTHLENDDSTNIHIYENVIGTIGSAIVTGAINRLFIQRIPFLNNNFTAHNIMKVTRGLARVEIARYIIKSHFYKKYAELRADDGIPNEKALLESEVQYFHQEHEQLLDAIDNIKSSTWKEIINRPDKHRAMLNTPQVFAMKILPKKWFDMPFVTNAICYPRATHPCGKQRELRFLNKLTSNDHLKD